MSRLRCMVCVMWHTRADAYLYTILCSREIFVPHEHGRNGSSKHDRVNGQNHVPTKYVQASGPSTQSRPNGHAGAL